MVYGMSTAAHDGGLAKSKAVGGEAKPTMRALSEEEKGMGDVEERVKGLLLDMLDIAEEDITPKARFVDDLKATSIDIIEIVSALQNTFDVDIGDSEVARLVTVQDAVDFLKSAIGQKGDRRP
jgi:acyl carrier protein